MLPVGPAMAQTAVARSFVVTRDADTLVIEHIERAGDRVHSDFLDKSQGLRITLTMVLARGDLVTRSEILVRMSTAAPDSPPLQHVTLVFEPGTVSVTAGDANSAPAQHVPVPPGALPFLNLSVATAEQILMRAKSLGGTTAQVPIFSITGGQVTTATVQWSDAGNAVMSLAGVDLHARVSPSGEIVFAEVSAQKVRFAIEGSPEATAPLPSV